MEHELKPAETEREWWAMLKSQACPFVRTLEEWQATLADSKRNPLVGCDPKAVAHFTKSLKFANGGLGHADYSQVENQLTYPQFKRLWATFGMSMRMMADHDGYYCSAHGTCTQSGGQICTSNC